MKLRDLMQNGKVVIPDSVTEIGFSAFRGCTGLTSIEIPDSVTSIRGGAFLGCTGLTSIYITTKNPEYVELVLSEITEYLFADKITLHVPVGTGYAYRHSEVGKYFKKVIAENWKKNKEH